MLKLMREYEILPLVTEYVPLYKYRYIFLTYRYLTAMPICQIIKCVNLSQTSCIWQNFGVYSAIFSPNIVLERLLFIIVSKACYGWHDIRPKKVV